MCSINHDLKAIFIHLPKCGGSFTTSMLKKYYDFDNVRLPHEKHKNFNYLFEEIPQILEEVKENEEEGQEVTGEEGQEVIGEEGQEVTGEEGQEVTGEEGQESEKKCDCYGCRGKSYGDPWTTTEQGILRYNSSSKIYNFTMDMNEEKWKTYKKFTILRNPYDKIVSAWKFINKCLKDKKKQDVELLDFEEYLDKSKEEMYKYCKFAYSHSHITQYEHLLDANNELDITYMGCQENLNEDLCTILLKIGVEKIKHRFELEENKKINSNEHLDYIEYYTDTILEKVNKILQKDFDHFKQYKQVFSVEEMKEESKKYLVSIEEFNKKNSELIERLERDGVIVEKYVKKEKEITQN
jgi:hypothetical protein